VANVKSVLHNLVYGNRAIIVCVFFTIATMLDLILCVPQGILDTSFWHLGMRFILCICASLSLLVFRYFEKLSLPLILLIHCLISVLIMILFVWLTGLYTDLHPHAYRDGIRTVFIIYPVIIVGGLFIDATRTARANRILKRTLE